MVNDNSLDFLCLSNNIEGLSQTFQHPNYILDTLLLATQLFAIYTFEGVKNHRTLLF